MAAEGGVNLLQGYKKHITSEFLADRYPYLEDIRSHLKHDEVSMAHGDRLFPRLVEQLKTPDMAPEKLCEALRTICDLTSNQESKCVAIDSDVVEAATNLLTHDSIPVRREAARVIGALALLIGARSLMPAGNANMARKLTGASGGGPTLPRLAKLLLGCDDAVVKMNVSRALQAVTILRDGCQQAVDQGTVKSIAQYLCATLPDLPPSEPLAMCLPALMQTLAAVTMYATNGMRDLFGVKLIERIVGFLAKIPKDGKMPHISMADSVETQRQCLRVLWHCGNDPQGRKETLQANGVNVITIFLSSSDSKVREAAVCALNVFSLETKGKQDVLRDSLEGLATLLLNKDNETPYLHETCVQLVRSTSELPAFRFAFARRIVGYIWLLEKVYGTASLAACSPLLRPEESRETRQKALQVTLHFLQKPSQGDEIRVPPVSPLENTMRPDHFAVEECVDILHDLVSLLDVEHDTALQCLQVICNVPRNRDELSRMVNEGRLVMSATAEPEVRALIADA